MLMHQLKTEPSKARRYFPRPALEQLLNECEDRNVILVHAPSGSGKSALIAHYIDKCPGLVCWYNLDAADNDPAAFLSRLRLAIEQVVGSPLAFPPFAGDYLVRLDVYGKQLISALLDELGPESSLIFDDCHLLQQDSPVHGLLNIIASQLLDRQQMIVLSRRPVMFPSSRWSAERHILRLDWSHFRLDHEELAALIQQLTGSPADDGFLMRLMRQTDGRIADAILQLDRDERLTPDSNSATEPNQFIEQGLNLTTDQWQQLCQLAEFPVIDADVIRAMKLDTSLIDVLISMEMHGKLVSQLQAEPPRYRLHDLMRDHLRRKRSETLSPDSLNSHLNQVAEVLLGTSQEYDALRFLAQAGALDRIVDVIREHALGWLQQGKYYTLRQALMLLDGSKYEVLPWMRFFQGALCKFAKPGHAISLFQLALDGFDDISDKNGEKLALGEMLDTIQYHGEDFHIATPLLARAMVFIENTPADEGGPADAMLGAYAGVMFLIHKGEPLQSLFCIEHAASIADGIPGLELLTSYLYVYRAIGCDVVGRNPQAGEFFAQAEALYSHSPEHPPHRFMFNFLASVHEIFAGCYTGSLKRGLETLEYMHKWGLQQHDEHLLTRVAESRLGIGDAEPVSDLLSQLDEIPRRSTFSRAVMLQVEAHFWLEKNQPYQALQAARQCVRLMEKIGAEIYCHSTGSLMTVALTELGDFEQAATIQADTLKWADGVGSELQRFTTLIHQAWRHLRENRQEQMLAVLRQALETGARHGMQATYHWIPDMMSRLLATAMEHEIEKEYTRSLITQHDLFPPDDLTTVHGWPWRVRVYCFGKPQVIIDDKPVTSGAWKGGKTFALLLALLAEGGEQVPVDTLVDNLWPDAEGDKAKQNFEFTLRRLRAVMSLPGSKVPLLQLKSGRLSLNPHYCWVDSQVFDKLLQQAGGHSVSGIDTDLATKYRQQAVALYRGPFLADVESDWIPQRRQQARQQLLSTLSTILDTYRGKRQWQQIITLCQDVLAIEPGVETLQIALQEATQLSGRTP